MDNPYCDVPYYVWLVIENCKVLNTIPDIAWAVEVPFIPLSEVERSCQAIMRLWD